MAAGQDGTRAQRAAASASASPGGSSGAVSGGAVVVSSVVVAARSVIPVVAEGAGVLAALEIFHSGSSFGSGNASGSNCPIAEPMNRCQICAGKLPPVTGIPCTLVIEILALGYPTQTVVPSRGV